MRRATLLLAIALAGGVAVGCAPSTPPDGSLPCDPSIDSQRAAGFDTALEATVPLAAFDGSPITVDSGRECSEKRLGPLWGAGVRELRSAGGIFDLGSETGYSVVTYRASELTLDALAYAFQRGASTGRKTQDIQIEKVNVGEWTGSRMTLLNGDHRQVIILFQVPGEAGQVRGLLTSDISNAAITELLARYELALE
jgi:hypothetical protein